MGLRTWERTTHVDISFNMQHGIFRCNWDSPRTGYGVIVLYELPYICMQRMHVAIMLRPLSHLLSAREILQGIWCSALVVLFQFMSSSVALASTLRVLQNALKL